MKEKKRGPMVYNEIHRCCVEGGRLSACPSRTRDVHVHSGQGRARARVRDFAKRGEVLGRVKGLVFRVGRVSA